MIDGATFKTYGLIKIWEEKLPLEFFFRIHRSTIVNLNNIVRVTKGTFDSGILQLKNSERNFEISRNYFSQMKNKYKLTGNL